MFFPYLTTMKSLLNMPPVTNIFLKTLLMVKLYLDLAITILSKISGRIFFDCAKKNSSNLNLLIRKSYCNSIF